MAAFGSEITRAAIGPLVKQRFFVFTCSVVTLRVQGAMSAVYYLEHLVCPAVPRPLWPSWFISFVVSQWSKEDTFRFFPNEEGVRKQFKKFLNAEFSDFNVYHWFIDFHGLRTKEETFTLISRNMLNRKNSIRRGEFIKSVSSWCQFKVRAPSFPILWIFCLDFLASMISCENLLIITY